MAELGNSGSTGMGGGEGAVKAGSSLSATTCIHSYIHAYGEWSQERTRHLSTNLERAPGMERDVKCNTQKHTVWSVKKPQKY